MNPVAEPGGEPRLGRRPAMAALARIAAQLAAATKLEELTEIITERAAAVMGATRAVLAVRDGTNGCGPSAPTV